MSQVQARTLSGQFLQMSKSGDEVYFAKVDDGVLVCGFGNGKGGAFFVSASAMKRGEQLFSELSRGLGPGASFKFVGTDFCRAGAKKWAEKAGCRVISESVSAAFEAFVYPQSGRIRLGEVSKPTVQATAAKTPDAPVAKVRALIVDDSKTIRQLLRQILTSDSSIEVVGEAELPSQVEGLIEKLKPDVITLDINMPEMDGVTLLEKYLPKYKIPTVMVTALSMNESDQVFRALNLGAVDYIQKPSMAEVKGMTPLIVEKIKTAAKASLKRASTSASVPRRAAASAGQALDYSTVLAVGASTGGVQALESFFKGLPDQIPPTVVVQHIPPVFSAAFAKRLNDVCPFEVKEAVDGDEVRENRVLIAAGGTQMELVRQGNKLAVRVFDGSPVNRHKPSVDVLFDSVASLIGKNAVGVILTGMGADGAKGLLKMRQAGAHTVAQDQESCVVFGMPREAIELGAAEQVKSLQEIPDTVVKFLQKRNAA